MFWQIFSDISTIVSGARKNGPSSMSGDIHSNENVGIKTRKKCEYFSPLLIMPKWNISYSRKKTHRNGSNEWFINVFLVFFLPPLGIVPFLHEAHTKHCHFCIDKMLSFSLDRHFHNGLIFTYKKESKSSVASSQPPFKSKCINTHQCNSSNSKKYFNHFLHLSFLSPSISSREERA